MKSLFLVKTYDGGTKNVEFINKGATSTKGENRKTKTAIKSNNFLLQILF